MKLSLSFNLLFLVTKLSNLIMKGLDFEESSTFLPILNISRILFSIFCLFLLSEALAQVLLTFKVFCQVVDYDADLSLSLIIDSLSLLLLLLILTLFQSFISPAKENITYTFKKSKS